MRLFGAALAALALVACDGDGDSKDTDTGADTTEVDADADGYSDDEDCDDDNDAINPDADEVCDGVDNNCDGAIDEDTATDAVTWFPDLDADGYGDGGGETVTSCAQPSGYAGSSDDCDDSNPDNNPGADEVCNGLDDDCDGLTDDADDNVDLSTGTTFYGDADTDGYGDPKAATDACDPPKGTVTDNTDCDDTSADVNPAAGEVCNSIDDDCDALVDDADDSVDLKTGSTYYADLDGDTYGDEDNTTEACALPKGYVEDSTDCDDFNTEINPAATEVCDDDDNDCDGLTDDDDDSLDTSTGQTFYADGDRDGYGDAASAVDACEQPSRYVSDDTDCDDTDGNINPAATEQPGDEVDQDCDTSELCYVDADDDGYRLTSTITSADLDCTDTGEARSSDPTGECDDSDSSINPGETEVCDEIDNDCDGDVDDDDSDVDTTVGGNTFYDDDDGDGFGDPDDTVDACELPSGYSEDDTDCDDTNGDVNDDAAEVCNDIDDDCDGDIDDDDSSVTDQRTWYGDLDDDGYGDADETYVSCDQPTYYVSDDTDCDDTDEDVNPGEAEVCDEIDNDCDGDVDEDDSDVDSCFTGLTVSDLSAGDLIITEFMADAAMVSDSNGEWFEIYNASGDVVELEDLVLTDNAGSHTISGSVQIAADSYAVLCINDDTSLNGGQDCDYDYSGLALSNAGDEIHLSYDGTTFDSVDYSSWSPSRGASFALSTTSECVDADDNDNEGLWCTESTETYGDGDYGTPGEENSADCLSSTDYGFVTTSSSSASAPSGVSVAWEITVDSDSYLTDFEANAAYGGFGNLKLALYDDDGGEPGNLIAQSEDTSESAGNFTLDIDTDSTSSDTCDEVLPAGTYWIAAKGTRTTSTSYMGYLTWTNSGSYSSYYTAETYASDFPDPYNGTSWTAGYRLHIGIVTDAQ